MVLVDIDQPGVEAESFLATIRYEQPLMGLVIFAEEVPLPLLQQCQNLKKVGFQSKECSPHALLTCIQSVSAGDNCFHGAFSKVIDLIKADGKVPRFSPREGRVAELRTDGKTNKEISTLLNIGLRTVETHIRHINQKRK